MMRSAKNLRHQEQPLHIDTLSAPERSTLIRFVATALLLTFAACSQLSDTKKPTPDKNATRAQLSMGCVAASLLSVELAIAGARRIISELFCLLAEERYEIPGPLVWRKESNDDLP
jgi:hypothetical protein